ncbi:hypothetical protein YC2023_066091 [Brassica napus]
MTSVGVRQHTQDVRGCPSAHIGRQWLSISTHICTLVLGLSMLALSVDCLDDFGPCGVSIQYTQDVRGCPPAHTGCPWLSISTHMTSVAVRVCPCVSVCVCQHTQEVCGCPSVHISARWLSVQYTQDVRGCPSAHKGRPCVSVSTHRTSLAVRVCPSAHTGRPWLSISTHISTLVLGLRKLTLPVDCSGDFGPRGLSVQYTQDVRGTHSSTLVLGLSKLTLPMDCSGDFGPRGLSVQYTQDSRGCPPAHTGRLWLSVSTHRTSVAVHVCQSAHTGRPWLSISTHSSTLVHGLSMLTLPMDCSVHTGRPWVSASTQRTSVAVRGCPSAHTGRPWLSMCVRVCLWVYACTHMTSVAVPHKGLLWLSICRHISMLVLGLSMLALLMDCLGDFGPCGLSVQYTQASAGVGQHTPDVRGFPCVSMCVRLCLSAHIGRQWLSISTHISTLVLGLTMLTVPVDCLGDFGPCNLSVHYTKDVLGCLPTHIGRSWLSVCVRGCPQHEHDVRGCPSVHISARWSLDSARWPFPWTVWVILAHVGSLFSTHRMSVGVRQHTQDVCGCTWLSVSTHRTSVAVHVCLWVSACVCGCPRASVGVRVHTHDVPHKGRLWLSISTHISMLVLGLSTLALPVDCLGDFGPCGLSVQYTQDIRGCQPTHTGRLWLSVSTHRTTHRTSVAVRVCPSAHTRRPWLSISTHISTLVLGLSMLTLPVDCSGDFSPRGLSVQYIQDVRRSPPAHIGRLWLSVSTHSNTLVLGLSTLTFPVDCSGDFVPVGRPWLSVCVRVCPQHTHDVRGCPSVHISVRWSLDSARWPFSWTVWVNLAHVGCLFSTHMTSVGVHQHTHDVCVCPWLSVSTHRTSVAVHQYKYQHVGPWTQHAGPSRELFGTSVAVRGCSSSHIGRQWLSISTHISTLVLGLSTLALPVDSLGGFGPRGLSVQYTHDVRGCPPAHTGRLWLSVAVRQHTKDVRGCPCVSMCVRVCPSEHTGRLCLSISTHISTLVLGLSTLALPVDCSGDFDPRRLSVQYTQDVRGCPSAHAGHPWVSASTHKTYVAVRVCPSAHTRRQCPSIIHTGRPWVSASTQRTSVAVRGCPSAHTGHPWLSMCVRVCLWVYACTHMTSVAVRQHTHDVCVCPSAHTGRPYVSVCVCVCPSAHKGLLWLSICRHISMLVLGLSMLALLMDCLGDFGPCGLSVQYTQDVRGCRPAHTGRPTLVLGLTMLTVPVDCLADFGPRGLSVHYTKDVLGTHISTLVLGLSTLALPVDCLGDFGPRGVSVQYTQDVRGCPPAHTGCLWLYVAICQHTQDVRGCPSVSVCVCGCPHASVGVRVHTHDVPHKGRLWLSISTDISMLVLGLSTLALPVDCLGDFGPFGLSVQYTQDIRGCQPTHTGRLWLSVSTHRTFVAVCVCPCVSVFVRQHTQDVRGCPSVHISARCTHRTSMAVRVCPSAHTRRPWLSISTHISTLVLGLSMLTLPVDCSGDFSPRGLSVQYIQDVRRSPPAHIGRLWLSVSTHSNTTHRTSVGVRQHTQDVRGCPCVSVCVRSTHMTSVAVHQYTYQYAGPWTQHVGPSRGLFGTHMTSVAVRGCPSAHIGRQWLSISTNISTLVLGLSTLALPVNCLGDFGPRGLSVHTHFSTLVLGLSTLALPVDCLGGFGPRGLSVQYTHDVRGCPPAHTGRLWLSVAVRQHTKDIRGCPCVSMCVRVCPSEHTGRLWLSISTHISTLVLGLSTLALPVDCSGDFDPRRLSVQYTQDVRGCPSAHTGRPCVSVSTHRTSVAVRVCPSAHTERPPTWVVCSVHTGRPWVSASTHRRSVAFRQHTYMTSVAVNQYTYQHVDPWTQHADPSRGLTSVAVRGCLSTHTGRPWLSMCVRQHTHDVSGCLSAYTGRPYVSVCVRVYPSAHTRRQWLSISTHICTLVLGLSTLALSVDCLCDSGPRGLSVQYTQDVRGCPPAHTGCPWLFVAVCQHTQDVRGCTCVSASTHMTSAAVRQHTQDVRMFPCVSMCIRQQTKDIYGCPSVHISACWSLDSALWPFPWTDWVILAHVGCLFSTHRTSVGVGQHTQDVCGCPTHRTSVAVHQYTYQHVGPWPQPADPSRGLFGTSVAVRVCPSVSVSTHMTSVAVHQLSVHYTQDVRGCPPAHTERLSLSVSTHRTSVAFHVCPTSVAVRVCPCVSVNTHRTFVCVRQHTHDVRGCPSVHISARWSFGLSTPSLPVDCLGDFGPRGGVCLVHKGRPWVSASTHRTSVAVRGCLSAHTGRPWLSVCVHVCPSVSVSTHRTSVAVHQYTYQHAGPWTQHAGPSRGLFGTSVCVRRQTQDVCGCPCVSLFVHQHKQDVRGCPSGISKLPGNLLDCLECAEVVPKLKRKELLDINVAEKLLLTPMMGFASGRSFLGLESPSKVGDIRLGLNLGRWYLLDGRFGRFGETLGISKLPGNLLDCLECAEVVPKLKRKELLDINVAEKLLLTPMMGFASGRSFLGLESPSKVGDIRLGLNLGRWYLLDGRTLTLPVDCLGDFGPHGLAVQYTHDVRGCPPAHTGRLWLSVAVRQHTQDVCGTHRTSVAVHQYTYQHAGPSRGLFGKLKMFVAVRVCSSAHTGRLWLSISTHISTLVLGLSTLTLPVDCLGDFGPHGLAVQYTQDVRGCPPAHTGRLWLSVAVRQHTQDVCGCPCVSMFVRVCPSAHTGCLWLSIITHIITLVLGLSTLALPTDCSGDFGPGGLSVQYTHDVHGCPPTQTGRLWLSVCVRPCLSAHTGRLWLSISTLVLGLSTLALPVDCFGDFGPVGLSVQYTHDVCGTQRTSVGVRQHTHDVCVCPSAHIGRPWLSVCVRVCPSAHTGRSCVSDSTHMTSVAVHQYTYQHVGPLDSARFPFPWTVWVILAHVVVFSVHTGCPWVSASTHRMSVAFRQHTLDIHGCPCVSMCVRVCPLAHKGRSWLSISTHISTLVLGLSTLALPVDYSGYIGPRGLSVQYIHDVRGCPSTHTGRPCVSVGKHRMSVAVRLCLCVFVSTHRMSVAVHQYTYQHVGPWTQHADPSRGLFGCSVHTGCLWVSASTHRTSVAVRGCPSAHTGRLWVLASTHRTSVAVCVCPCVSVCVRQHTQDVCGCPSVHISARWSLDSARWPFPWTVRVILAHVGCLFRTHRRSWVSISTHRMSVWVRQQTQDVCGCPCVFVSTHRTSMAVHQYTYQHVVHTGCPWVPASTQDVCGCPWLSVSTHRTSVAVRGTHIITLVLGLSTLALPADYSGDFGPRGLSVQYTQNVRGCPSAHTGHPCVSVSTHRMFVAVCVCPCVSVSTHGTSVTVHQWAVCSVHTGRPWVSASTHRTSVAVRLCPSVSVSTHRMSVAVHQHDVCGCPPAHTERLWLSGSTHRTSVAVCVCPSAHRGRLWVSVSTQMTFVCVRRSCVSDSTHMTSVAVHQYTYQHVGPLDSARFPFPWTVWVILAHVGVFVKYTQDVRGCPPAHTGCPWLSVSTHRTSMAVRVCPCVSVCVR